MKQKVMAIIIVFFLFMPLNALDLKLNLEDIRIEQKGDGGYHLYIRKKKDISSVILAETTKDPNKKENNFTYRAKEYNTVNGDEQRILDGKVIPKESKIYSLIDSTIEADTLLGTVYHIFIPYVVEYGYAWSRNGELFVSDGTFINIRSFEKPYADYTGAFLDNPYLIKVTQKPLLGNKEDNYMKDTVTTFKEIANGNNGTINFSPGDKDLSGKIGTILDSGKGKSIDVVLCLDTTDSMTDDILSLKRDLVNLIKSKIKGFDRFRIGMVLYKDYYEEYVTKAIPFTEDLGVFQTRLDSVRVYGGRDIPEAVFEALYAGVSEFLWESEVRLVILVGDAPPHPIPRGSITEAMVQKEAKIRSVSISVIILAQ